MSTRRFDCGSAFAVRVSLLPLDAVTRAGATGDATDETITAQRRWLTAILDRADVREAILIASPALHAEIDGWRAKPDSAHGRKIEQALIKYVTRMATRATPYGLCAGIAAGRIEGQGVQLGVLTDAGRRRRSRIDNEVLFRLADVLARDSEVRERLDWSPNTSLVKVAGRWRYAEARTGDGNALRYHLIAVDPTPYFDATIDRARGGATLARLAEALVADECVELVEARAYVDELVSTQVLVPSLGVMVTGPEPIDGMIRQLVSAGVDDHARALGAIRERLVELDGRAADAAAYARIAVAIEAMFTAAGSPTTVERARLFQIDTSAPIHARLGRDVVAEIERTIESLRTMTTSREHPGLAELRRAFRDRWEDREVPLAEVLDEEAGIGFNPSSAPGNEGAPLLEGLPIGSAGEDASHAWGARERWLLGRLAGVWAAGEDELILDERDLKALAAPTPADLPQAWSVLARAGRSGATGRVELLVESAGGPSGARLLGRFCHLDPGIEEMVREHIGREEASRSDAVFAEVAHLADGRAGNILCRPVLRAHEIVYLGRSGAPSGSQILVEDLMMTVRDGRIVLRSRRLDREVVPRLTSAHNVSAFGVGVYRFLAAVQHEGCSGVGWSWGALADAPRLPRVRLGNVVVARACWRLDGDELRALRVASRQGCAAAFVAMQSLRARRQLSRHVVVADGDNELWVDLDHALQVDAMVASLRSRDRATLTEAWPAPGDTVACGVDGPYASEIIVAFTHNGPAKVTAKSRIDVPESANRSFAPGSRWLYAKLYGGVSSADRVIREVVGPAARAALASGAARRWFFLRYADPQPHIRLRFDGDPSRLAAETLPALHAAVAPLLANGTLWRIQLDTYEREVERYGGAVGIGLCEDIFWHDSEAALSIVEQLDGDSGAEARWQLALVSAERLLAALGLDASKRERVFAQAKESLAKEHRAGAPLLKAIGERWRTHEMRISGLLDGSNGDGVEAALSALQARDARIRSHQGARMSDALAWSLVHMSCNRLLHASARAQELVIYEMLRRWHGRQRARARMAPGAAA